MSSVLDWKYLDGLRWHHPPLVVTGVVSPTLKREGPSEMGDLLIVRGSL